MDRWILKEENKIINKQMKIGLTITAILLLVVIVLLACWFSIEPQTEPKITIEGTVLKVKGLYPKTIELAGAEITLTGEPLSMSKRIAGSNYPNKHVSKGKFKNNEGEIVYLSLMNSIKPYIVIDNGSKYYINRKHEEDTLELYDRIIEAAGIERT